LADIVIWRYMDLARYAVLLNRGLHFASANSFQDPWEASFCLNDLKQFREANTQLTAIEIQGLWDKRISSKRKSLSRLGVSCWHISDHESSALWEIYQPKGLGIAVKSTVSRLYQSIIDSERRIETLPIKYSNYHEIDATDDPYLLLTRKRPEFLYENEIRFVIKFRTDEISEIEFYQTHDREHRVVSSDLSRPAGKISIRSASPDRSLNRRVTNAGMHLDIKHDLLIEKVIVSPYASYPTRDAISSITKAYGLNQQIISISNMEQPSFDKIIFEEPTGYFTEGPIVN
jgi:hypothetical protein